MIHLSSAYILFKIDGMKQLARLLQPTFAANILTFQNKKQKELMTLDRITKLEKEYIEVTNYITSFICFEK